MCHQLCGLVRDLGEMSLWGHPVLLSDLQYSNSFPLASAVMQSMVSLITCDASIS